MDLKGGWWNQPRSKTAIDRRAKLWPETLKSIRDVIASNPKPVDDESAKRVLLQRTGINLGKPFQAVKISQRFATVLDAVGLKTKREDLPKKRHGKPSRTS